MKTDLSYHTATPAQVDRILAQAQAERSAYIAALAATTGAKLRGLFAKTPRRTVPA